MIPHMSHEDLKQIGVKTFGQRFLIISAGNKLNLVAKEDTVEENTFHDTTNPVAEEIPDKFSITDILEVQLPYERSYSSAKVKNAPRKSEELVISNLEDYCSGDRGEMLTVLEIMNFTEPVYRGSDIDTAEAEVSNNNISSDSENVFNPPLESTSIGILREAEEEYDTEISLLLDQIMGNEKSVIMTKDEKIKTVLKISTGNVDNAEIIEDIISKRRKPQYINDKIKKKKRRKMGW